MHTIRRMRAPKRLDLPVSWDGERAEVTLPSVVGHAMVVLEQAGFWEQRKGARHGRFRAGSLFAPGPRGKWCQITSDGPQTVCIPGRNGKTVGNGPMESPVTEAAR